LVLVFVLVLGGVGVGVRAAGRVARVAVGRRVLTGFGLRTAVGRVAGTVGVAGAASVTGTTGIGAASVASAVAATGTTAGAVVGVVVTAAGLDLHGRHLGTVDQRRGAVGGHHGFAAVGQRDGLRLAVGDLVLGLADLEHGVGV